MYRQRALAPADAGAVVLAGTDSPGGEGALTGAEEFAETDALAGPAPALVAFGRGEDAVFAACGGGAFASDALRIAAAASGFGTAGGGASAETCGDGALFASPVDCAAGAELFASAADCSGDAEILVSGG